MKSNDASGLKTLQITEASCAGVGGHVLDLIGGLSQRGCQCHLIYSPRRADETFLERLQQLPQAQVAPVAMRRWPHGSDWRALRALKRYVADHGPFDIVHAHSTKAGGLARLKKLPYRPPVVYTPNGIFTMNPQGGRLTTTVAKRVERWLGAKSAAMIAVSPEEHAHMLELGLPRQRIHLIPNGIRAIEWPDRAAIRRELGFVDSDLVIGFVGRLAPQKDPQLLLEAFAQLPLSHARLAMVGTGPLMNACRGQAERLGISKRVVWTGYRTAQRSMPAFDVLVMPSRYEGMPYVLMEGVSYGLPVIATRVGGTSLIVEEESNGLLVDSGDREQLAKALQRVITSPDLRRRFAVAAQQKRVEFSVDRMVDSTLRLYWKIADAARTAAP